MNFGNETPAFECRFLDESYFEVLLERFGEAFSGYARPFELDLVKFRNHINLNAIDLNRSVGCFKGRELIGFSLNGFGQWKGKATVYDGGTGVIPAWRRLGASEAMFRFMVPKFKDAGIEQFLLEVITNNTPAVTLYQKLGFEIERELLLMDGPANFDKSTRPNPDVRVRRMTADDLDQLKRLWEARPSWQNSNEAISRCEPLRT
ncbi:MAG: GNAT family N-acetyltransferase, partial [Acidobacteria bacterium]|nr:GNAT family N-acetyltransferase [Acidobacteriota bacterium]